VNQFNEEAIKKGWNHPKDESEDLKSLYVYAALKTETEKKMWKWVEENKPGFVFNAVVRVPFSLSASVLSCGLGKN